MEIPNIKANFFGDFQLYINGKEITYEDWKSKKALTVYKFLLYHRNTKIEKDILVELLWPDGNRNRAQNLYTTIYNLQKTLNSFIDSDQKFKFTICSNGLYWCNNDIDYEIDTENFKKYHQKGIKIEPNDKTKALDFYQTALIYYTNDFLTEELYTDWIIEQRAFFREIYIDLALKTAQIISETTNKYEIPLKICKLALTSDKYREELHEAILHLLLKLNRNVEATKWYNQYSKMVFQEFGLTPSFKIRELFEKVDTPDNKQSDIISYRESSGPFQCDKHTFEIIYELELRRQKRNQNSFMIMLLHINESKQKQKSKIINTLSNLLRESDCITLWNQKLIIALLFKGSKKAGQIIKKRLSEVMKINNFKLSIKLQLIEPYHKNKLLNEIINKTNISNSIL